MVRLEIISTEIENLSYIIYIYFLLSIDIQFEAFTQCRQQTSPFLPGGHLYST